MFVVVLDDLKGLFQPKGFYDSKIQSSFHLGRTYLVYLVVYG